ncbi:hypothetical protein J3E73DRAFT_395082 [Bipolaris maydis]|nr:hypothetical protein J3E73DRAFT_395082 [Bipolaris maydis]
MASEQARADETQVPTALAIVTIFTVLSCACVALRLYTRRIILRNVGADDYVIIVAQVLNFGVAAGNYAMLTAGGAGRHIEFVEDKLTILLAAILIYNATQIAIKISLLLQYRKIFPGRKYANYLQLGHCVSYNVGSCTTVSSPVTHSRVFTPFICTFTAITHIPQGVCVGNNTLAALNAVMNVVTDFLILIIPFKPVLQLQISIVCIISAIRLDMLIGPQYDWNDITWQIGTVAFLSTLETSLGIMCACISYTSATSKEIFAKDGGIKCTTELRDVSPKDPYQVSQRSSDDISL